MIQQLTFLSVELGQPVYGTPHTHVLEAPQHLLEVGTVAYHILQTKTLRLKEMLSHRAKFEHTADGGPRRVLSYILASLCKTSSHLSLSIKSREPWRRVSLKFRLLISLNLSGLHVHGSSTTGMI